MQELFIHAMPGHGCTAARSAGGPVNRMLVAIILSLAVHGALLLCRFGGPTNFLQVDDPLRIITVQLHAAPSPPTVQATAVPKIMPAQQKKIIPRPAKVTSQPQTTVARTPVANLEPHLDDNQPTTAMVMPPTEEAAPANQGNGVAASKPGPEKKAQLAHPLYLANQPPSYPPLARRQHYQGTTELAVLVTEDGTADDLRLQNSSGHPVLDRAAIAAVRNWKFAPGRQGSEAVAMWVTVPVRFELE